MTAVAAVPPPSPSAGLITYESYMAGPRLEGRYDILDGVRIEAPGQSWRHQEVVGRIVEQLRAFQRQNRTGRAMTAPLDVEIGRSPLRTRQPDVFFISNERLAELGGIPLEGPLPGGPELVVEVLSPSETPRTVREKLLYLASVGAQEAWLVSPESETVQVQRLSSGNAESAAVYVYGQTVTSEVVPGLSVAVADLFDE